MIYYHISLYFLRKLKFSDATIRYDVLLKWLRWKSFSFVLQVSLVMSSVTRNCNCTLFYSKSQVTCIWLSCADQQTLQHLRWSSLAVSYCSILNTTLFVVWFAVIFFYFSTTKSTTFAPKAKCKDLQSCLNIPKKLITFYCSKKGLKKK